MTAILTPRLSQSITYNKLPVGEDVACDLNNTLTCHSFACLRLGMNSALINRLDYCLIFKVLVF